MNKRIIYQNDEGGTSIIVPAPEALETMTIEEIAAKDVPAGVPYKIIDVQDLPTDRTFRNAWEVQIDEPDGYGAESNEFPPLPELTPEGVTE
jgi:hypothetical protein